MQHFLGSSLDITCFRHPDSGDVAKKSELICFCVVDYLPVDGQWNDDFALLNLNAGYPYNRF